MQRFSKTGASRRSWTTGTLAAVLGCLLTLACAYGGLSAGSAAAKGTSAHARATDIPVTQRLAVLLYEHLAYRSPRTNASIVISMPPHTPITREQTTLPVIGQASRGGRHWLRVMLPGRPNGATGWIEAGGTFETYTGWHIVVNIADRRVWVYFHGRLQRTFQAVVGKPSTPTPTGSFFVQETVIMPASEAGGPFALATSARSDALHSFNGGPGQIGIHGRDGLGGTLGTAESHGCVRLATPEITWLAARIVPGVPVTITG
jgi:lipoprotein-anchoring transpeptidase ErfK/SrfK